MINLALTVKSQNNIFNFKDCRMGDYVGISEFGALLREKPMVESSVIDSIEFNMYKPFIFKIIEDKFVNDFVHVEIVIKYRNIEMIDTINQVFGMPGGIIENGKKGWVKKNEIDFYSIPDELVIKSYLENNEVLDCILRHSEYQEQFQEKEYKKYYKPTHASCYSYLAIKNFENDSLQKSIYYMSKSIQILPKKESYKIRAVCKGRLGDYIGSIKDCTEGINIENSNSYKINKNKYPAYHSFSFEKYVGYDLYYIRGTSYLMLQEYIQALNDLNTAVLNSPNNSKVYYMRAFAKLNLNKKKEACLDFSKSGELGNKEAYEEIKKHCR